MIIFDLDCVKQNCDEIFKERAFSKSPAIFSLKVILVFLKKNGKIFIS